MNMTTEAVLKIIERIANRIQEEKQYLTELDNVIGDGDHGINMARGFQEVMTKLQSAPPALPGDVFKTVGLTLVAKVGGAAGPLYGTAFMNMGKVLAGKSVVSVPDFLTALQSAIDGVSMRGKSKAGEKTMLDAMIPALDAMNASHAAGKDVVSMLEDGIKAAWNGVAYTKTIAATKGRASYLGERSIGHQDPGATSFAMMLEELKKAVV